MNEARRTARQRARQERGAGARVSGRRAEVICALLLMLRGYRIIGFRLKTPQGEIDILAFRRGVLAVIEVKRRATLQAALEAVTHGQRERLRRAGAAIANTRPALSGAAIRLDLMAVAPGQLPRHVPNAWPGG